MISHNSHARFGSNGLNLLFAVIVTIALVLPSSSASTHVLHGWAAVIPALVSAIGGYIASRKAGKKSSTDRQLEQQQLESSKFLMPYGQKLLGQSDQAFQIPFQHYSTIAKGNRSDLTRELQPELSAYDEAERSGLSSMAELAPRGGASSDVLSRLPFKRAQNIMSMFSGARQNAFAGLSTLGSNFGQLGLNALTGGQAGNMNLLNYGLNRNNQQFQQGSEAGSSMFALAKAFSDAYTNRSGQGQQLPINGNVWGQQGGWTPSNSTMTPKP